MAVESHCIATSLDNDGHHLVGRFSQSLWTFNDPVSDSAWRMVKLQTSLMTNTHRFTATNDGHASP